MRILCLDRSRHGLMALEQTTRHIMPDAAIHGCRDPDEVLNLAKQQGCDVLLTEIDLGNAAMDGFVLAQRIAEINPLVNIIFVTERMDNANAKLALDLHASGFVSKPLDREGLAEQFKNLRHAAV